MTKLSRSSWPRAMRAKDPSKSFAGRRYVTSGVADRIAPEVQAVLWRMIDNKRDAGEELDYIQMFELSASKNNRGEEVQIVVQRQERPAFVDAEAVAGLSVLVTERVWVVDDGECSTMMLPEEY